MFRKSIFTLLSLYFSCVFGQENISESSLDIDYQNTNLEDYFNRTEELLDAPVSLNCSSIEELQNCGLFSTIQVMSICDYREKYGKFESIYELNLLSGFNEILINKISDFITIKCKSKENNSKKFYSHHDQTISYSDMTGISEDMEKTPDQGGYLGNSYSLYSQIKGNINNKFFYALTGEKDRGEFFRLNDSVKGFDMYSGYLSLKQKTFQIILGNFHASFGQGVILQTGFSMGKSFVSTNKCNTSKIFRETSSKQEYSILRGIAISKFYRNRILIGMYYSNTYLDARLTDDNEKILTIYENGSHATLSEYQLRHSAKLQNFGASIQFREKNWKIGSQFVSYIFSNDFETKEELYNKYQFSGKSMSDFSIDARLNKRKFELYSELASDNDGDFGFISGLDILITDELKTTLIYRNYSKKYNSFYASAFSESGKVCNEKGFYIGSTFTPFDFLTVNGYYDVFSFPWLEYRTVAPSIGNEYALKIDLSFSQSLISLKLKREEKEQYFSSETSDVKKNENQIKSLIGLNISTEFNQNWSLANSLQISKYSYPKKNSNGFLFCTDLVYKPLKKSSIKFRFAVFESDYNARLYAYESDISQSFSVHSYYNTGYRLSCIVTTYVADRLKIQYKISRTEFTNDGKLITESDEYSNQESTDFKILLNYSF